MLQGTREIVRKETPSCVVLCLVTLIIALDVEFYSIFNSIDLKTNN